jgi:hypothetical protein
VAHHRFSGKQEEQRDMKTVRVYRLDHLSVEEAPAGEKHGVQKSRAARARSAAQGDQAGD